MGLDQYAYAGVRPGQREEFYETAEKTEHNGWVSDQVTRPRELMYWRKHPNLQGYMERLWRSRLGADSPYHQANFNGIEIELHWADIEQLEQVIQNRQLPSTTGFFFGDASDDHYRDQDLDFCREARAALFLGERVFYNSSW
jgi:hypothetical protein